MGVDRTRAERAIEEFLRALGHDPASDPELGQTGKLVAEAYANDLLGGYAMDPSSILSDTMPTPGSDLVVVRDVAATAVCPHHLLPASGKVHLAYVPSGRVAGLGALVRLVDCFARRLTLQETMAQRVADAMVEHLGAEAAGCAAHLKPACLTARGARSHDASVISIATAGAPTAADGVRVALVALVGEAS